MKRRSAGLTVFDLLQRKKNLRVAAVLLAGLFDSDDSSGSGSDSGEEEADDDHVAKDDISEIVSYVFVKKVVTIDKPLRIFMSLVIKNEMTINFYSDQECRAKLRFRKPDIMKMIDLLGMPHYLHSVQRHCFSKVFSFILLLSRMAYPGRLYDLEQEFGREHTALSRSLNLTVHWFSINHAHWINDNLPFWMQYYDSFMYEKFPSESTNVGIEVEKCKSTMGEKGRITTTHCQTRALLKDPYDTLSKKLNEVGEELANFNAEVFTIQDADKDTADGILIR